MWVIARIRYKDQDEMLLQEEQVAVANDKTHELSKKGEETDGGLLLNRWQWTRMKKSAQQMAPRWVCEAGSWAGRLHTECFKLLKDDFTWHVARITGHRAHATTTQRHECKSCLVWRANQL